MPHLIGLHIRYEKSAVEVLDHAERQQVPIAQMFMHTESGIMPQLNDAERKQFIGRRSRQLTFLYAHGSYKINCADPTRTYHPALEHDIRLANALQCTHMILHAGSAATLSAGIDALARMVNKFHKQQYDLKLVFENTAFAAPSLGGDISHFRLLLEKIDKPDRLSFCIDTAHAHAAGYDLANKQKDFIHLLAETIGIERIALIHLNDTPAQCASHIDLHGQLGQGTIGHDALQIFALDEHVDHIPFILELPIVSEDGERQSLDLVKSWLKEKEK